MTQYGVIAWFRRGGEGYGTIRCNNNMIVHFIGSQLNDDFIPVINAPVRFSVDEEGMAVNIRRVAPEVVPTRDGPREVGMCGETFYLRDKSTGRTPQAHRFHAKRPVADMVDGTVVSMWDGGKVGFVRLNHGREPGRIFFVRDPAVRLEMWNEVIFNIWEGHRGLFATNVRPF